MGLEHGFSVGAQNRIFDVTAPGRDPVVWVLNTGQRQLMARCLAPKQTRSHFRDSPRDDHEQFLEVWTEMPPRPVHRSCLGVVREKLSAWALHLPG